MAETDPGYLDLLAEFNTDRAIIEYCSGPMTGDPRCSTGKAAAIRATNAAQQEPEAFTWSNENARLFYGIRDWLYETFDIKGLRKAELDGMLNIVGEQFFIENDRWPNLQDIEGVDGLTELGSTVVVDMFRRANGSDLLPEKFKMQNTDGTFTVFENSPTVGITPQIVFENTPESETESFGSSTREEFLARRETPDSGFGGATREQFLNRRTAGLPTVTQDTIDSLRSDIDPEEDETGGGRGKLSFDRAQVGETIREGWRTLMLEEPGNLKGLVSEYIGEANAFYQSEGGQKNLEAWLLGRMRQSPRYGMLYGRKDPSMSETDWLRSFDTSAFGLRAEDATAQQIRGMSSGAAPASFQQSVEQSRDVEALGQGRFSQRFANHINQLGRLQNR